MKTSDIAKPITANSLNESLYKQYNVKINFDKYSREELEDARNKYRSKLFAHESQANFNDLLHNESYQCDKFVLDVLNTRIKEMLGESIASKIAIMEKAVKAKKKEKPDFLDVDKDGNKKETFKKAVADKKKVKEAYDDDDDDEDVKRADAELKRMKKKPIKAANIDPDKDKIKRTKKDREEEKDEIDESYDDDDDADVKRADAELKRMKKKPIKAANIDPDKDKIKRTKKDREEEKDEIDESSRKRKVDKNKVKENDELMYKAYRQFIAEGIAYFIAEDEEGKAKSITAAADMVNDFTSWMQRVGNYQTKSMIELADNIRANFGMQEAEAFKSSVGSALEGALNALTQAREEINNAVAVLAGEAPAAEPMGVNGPGSDVGDTGMGDLDGMDTSAPDEMNPSFGDEFAASDAAAGGPETTGRLRRESIERGNRLMKMLGA